MDNVREYSNGESAFMYITEKIGDNGLYILDEPENSLSPKRQMELMMKTLLVFLAVSLSYQHILHFCYP